jgi:Flp pilus assembly protein TadG
MLEFALMLPFLLLLAVGVVDIGRAIYYTIAVNNGATAGAEYASQGLNFASLDPTNLVKIKQTAVCDAANGDTRQHLWNACSNGLLTQDNVTVTLGCRCANDTSGLSCDPMPNTACDSSFTCDPGVNTVECVRVQTTATFSPLFNWPGLPSSYTANGSAITRVRD